MFDAVSVEPHEVVAFWNEFPNSRAQRVLHNELVLMIEAEREVLEKAPLDEVLKHQANIFAFKKLLSALHRKDNKR